MQCRNMVRMQTRDFQTGLRALRRLRIAVIYGAVSEEDGLYIRSLPREEWSLTAIMSTLADCGLRAEHVDPTAANFPEKIRTYDVAYVNVHGPHGEDGRLQGLLDYLRVPYTSSGVLAGSVGMDKLVCKAVFQSLDIRTPWDAGLITAQTITRFVLPAMLKASDGGSSVGIRMVETPEEIAEAIAEFEQRGLRRFFLEEFIHGRTITVSVIASPEGPVVLPPLETVTDTAYYDETAKLSGHHNASVSFQVPDDLKPDTVDAMATAAETVYTFLDCRGAIRVDFIVNDDGIPFALEINTIPGVQRHGNLPVVCEHVGISYQELIVGLLVEALATASTWRKDRDAVDENTR